MNWSRDRLRVTVAASATVLFIAACVVGSAAAADVARAERATIDRSTSAGSTGTAGDSVRRAAVLRGRMLVITHACSGCHGSGPSSGANPASEFYLSGAREKADEFHIGACSFDTPKAKPCFVTRPRNLTPDNTTGLGRFSERQIFNALRFGLRPGETPDVEITSMVAGQGNFPRAPKYLAPPMPWPEWRHLTDQQLWDIAAYLKHGVKPVRNRVADSEGPPDFWASSYTPEKIGTYPLPPFPTAREQEPAAQTGTARAP